MDVPLGACLTFLSPLTVGLLREALLCLNTHGKPPGPLLGTINNTITIASNEIRFAEYKMSSTPAIVCYKCGGNDHIATNRNCPRPRNKPVGNTDTTWKKPVSDTANIKDAKVGDETKFWYYESSSSEHSDKDNDFDQEPENLKVKTYGPKQDDNVNVSKKSDHIPADTTTSCKAASKNSDKEASGNFPKSTTVKAANVALSSKKRKPMNYYKLKALAKQGIKNSSLGEISIDDSSSDNGGNPHSMDDMQIDNTHISDSTCTKNVTFDQNSSLSKGNPIEGSSNTSFKMKRPYEKGSESSRSSGIKTPTTKRKKQSEVSSMKPLSTPQNYMAGTLQSFQGSSKSSAINKISIPKTVPKVRAESLPRVAIGNFPGGMITEEYLEQADLPENDPFSAENISKLQFNYIGARPPPGNRYAANFPRYVEGWRVCRSTAGSNNFFPDKG
ncbi:hypothetical protein EDC01DRAFT_480935 [Geopyxis carbonaria]|nr:hypothetical protein EDC01DRAFT_480935 [Geopyxis carbonaria]